MNEEIVDGEFEEIVERDVILTKDLSEADLKKIADSETAEISPEDAAAFAAELDAVQKDVAAIQEPAPKLSQDDMIRALKEAMKAGVITKARKQRMLQEMGISKSVFTKKSTSKTTASSKRKAAKKARRKNRK